MRIKTEMGTENQKTLRSDIVLETCVPSPSGILSKETANKWSSSATDGDKWAQHTLVLPSFFQTDDVRDNNHGKRDDTTATRARNTSKANQLELSSEQISIEPHTIDCENPQHKLPIANKVIALISTTFLPNTSLKRPYKICIDVFAIRNDVPTQDTSLAASNSLATLGNAVDTLVWSKNANIKETASPKNTTNNFLNGSRDDWSWIDNLVFDLSKAVMSAVPSSTSCSLSDGKPGSDRSGGSASLFAMLGEMCNVPWYLLNIPFYGARTDINESMGFPRGTNFPWWWESLN